jgi:hypothetical protein
VAGIGYLLLGGIPAYWLFTIASIDDGRQPELSTALDGDGRAERARVRQSKKYFHFREGKSVQTSLLAFGKVRLSDWQR